MDKDLKEKWVEALRSGKYRQVTKALKRETRDGGVAYCCLGVLAECIDPEFFTDEKINFDNLRTKAFVINEKYFPKDCYGEKIEDTECNVELNLEILRKSGLTENDQKRLINMNDIQRKKFKYIANWIEKNL